MAYNLGNTLFTGDYANPNTPLWLSALNPTSPPANITVSSLTAAPSGGVILASSGTLPNADYGEVTFNRASGGAVTATQLTQNVSNNVPTKGADTDYLTVATQNHTVYDDLALAGLQIFGNQVTNPVANTGAAGYLTQGDLPFSVKLYTGQFETGDIVANNATVSTLQVSSFTDVANFITDIVTASTVNTNFFNTNQAQFSTLTSRIGNIQTINSSTITAEVVNVSTLRASTFSILNNAIISSLTVSTLGVLNANLNNISTGTLTAGIANISTLVTTGGGVVASTLVSENVSSVTAVLKEIFVSTLNFNATLSPNIDLGLGGIVGGIVGAVGANALSIGLGAAGLGTGIAGIAMARRTGTGINSNVFQTINGNSQLQFSTLGQNTNTIFTLTNALDYTHVPGSTIYTSTIVPAGSRAVRTVSDPLNLANSDGATGLGIQGYSQWEPVYPGNVQVNPSSITWLGSGANLNLGADPAETLYVVGGNGGLYLSPSPAGTGTLTIDATLVDVNNGDVSIYDRLFVGKISTLSSIQGPTGVPLSIYPGIITSTITVSSINLGAATQQQFVASSITTGTLSVTNNATVSQTVRLATNGGQLGSLGVFVGQVVLNPPVDGNSMSVQNDIQCETLGARSLLFTRGGVTAQGTSQLSSLQTIYTSTIALQASSIATNVITAPTVNTNTIFGLGMTPYPPIAVTQSSSNYPAGSFTIAGLLIQWGLTNGGNFPTVNFAPAYSAPPCVVGVCQRYGNVQGVASINTVTSSNYSVAITELSGVGFSTGFYWLALGKA